MKRNERKSLGDDFNRLIKRANNCFLKREEEDEEEAVLGRLLSACEGGSAV